MEHLWNFESKKTSGIEYFFPKYKAGEQLYFELEQDLRTRALSIQKHNKLSFNACWGTHTQQHCRIAQLDYQMSIDFMILDKVAKLQKQVDSLTKKLEEYEKREQVLQVAEVIDDEPVVYEPLFPVMEVTE